MGNNNPYPWPLPPDLTLLDYLFGGYIKNKVYANPVTRKENTQQRIREAFNAILPQYIGNATRIFLKKTCLEFNDQVLKYVHICWILRVFFVIERLLFGHTLLFLKI